MKTLKTFAQVLCVILVFTLLLSACGSETPAATPTPAPATPAPATPAVTEPEDEPAPAEVKMTDGYFFYNGPRTGDMDSWIRFNEDGTWYGKYFMGGVVEAGLYEVLDKSMDYISDFGPDGEPETGDDVIATANQVVAFTNYATGDVQEVAFTGDQLCDFSLGGMSHHNTLTHKPEYNYVHSVEEIAIAVQTFYYENDTGSSLTLYHNRTFNDYTTAGEDGTWDMAGGSYTLTSSDGNVYTLTVSENGKMANYVKGGDTLELSSTTSDALYTFEAVTMPDGLPMEIDIELRCKPDGSVEVVIMHDMMGVIAIDKGTFVIENMVFISFELENGGAFAGEPDFASATESGINVSVPYKADVHLADFGMDLSFDCVLEGAITA